jgi:hypothetical protein
MLDGLTPHPHPRSSSITRVRAGFWMVSHDNGPLVAALGKFETMGLQKSLGIVVFHQTLSIDF